MPAAIDLLKQTGVREIPERLNQNERLYSAQKAAEEIFNDYSFPKMKEAEQSSFLNKIYSAVKFLNFTAYKTYLLFFAIMEGTMSGVIFVGDGLSMGLLRTVIDYLFPINPINGKRFFCLLPKIAEKWLGELMYCLLECEETNEFLPGFSVSMAEKIKRVFDKMVYVNAALLNPANEHVKFNYRVKTVSSKKVNAFSLPAGGVMVYSGLVKKIDDATRNKTIRFTDISFCNGGKIRVDLSKVKTDDVLAALLGHEITHAACRHFNIRMVFLLANKIIMWICHGIFIGALKEKDNKILEDKLKWIENKISDFIELFKSRSHEYEADATAIYLAQRAHYNPLGILFLEEVLKQEHDVLDRFTHKNFEFLYTHPYAENRKLAAFAAINELDPNNLQQHIL